MALTVNQFWWLAVLGSLSLAVSLGGLLAVRWVVVSLPEDYFVVEQGPSQWRHRHPLVRWSWFVAKNVLGVILLAAGVTMLVTPGPGVLAILLGLSLVSVPGKRTLVVRILRNPHVLAAMNLVRARSHRPVLIVPSSHDAEARSEDDR